MKKRDNLYGEPRQDDLIILRTDVKLILAIAASSNRKTKKLTDIPQRQNIIIGKIKL